MMVIEHEMHRFVSAFIVHALQLYQCMNGCLGGISGD